MQSRSPARSPARTPTAAPLLRMLRCESVTPFGRPVVPLVNWILTASRGSGATSSRIARWPDDRSEEHTSELQSLMRISYAVFCLKKKKQHTYNHKLLYRHT